MEVGIIGTGNMGRILTEAIVDGKAVSPSSIIITNRSISKAMMIQKNYPEIRLTQDIGEIGNTADLIFICVKPHDVYEVAMKLQPELTKDKCVISITSPINVKQLESVLPCSVARVIPSITNRALSGVTLLSFGQQCKGTWKKSITDLFNHISTPVEIDEEITRVSSDIVSCGPAFFSYLTQRFILAAVHETKIDQETATIFASEMLIGLGELLRKGYYTLPTLQEKVCVKGGITGEGINVLENELGDIFEHLFQATHLKFEDDLAGLRDQYTSK
ncbi:late competence protein ComER [Bacillus sp. V3B]|uniref:late competence protein ComER n=1 Tax=Bacillus sp. V3B TaxID=2804915 RepID=UPI00210D9073|nr:late competence protein ComER [Bacillus sp. V3B]MCQ6273611.1 late competence protein ComER [Bacillus sp. V3B]